MRDVLREAKRRCRNDFGSLSLHDRGKDDLCFYCNVVKEIDRLRSMISPGDAAAYEESHAAKDAEIAALRSRLAALAEKARAVVEAHWNDCEVRAAVRALEAALTAAPESRIIATGGVAFFGSPGRMTIRLDDGTTFAVPVASAVEVGSRVEVRVVGEGK